MPGVPVTVNAVFEEPPASLMLFDFQANTGLTFAAPGTGTGIPTAVGWFAQRSNTGSTSSCSVVATSPSDGTSGDNNLRFQGAHGAATGGARTVRAGYNYATADLIDASDLNVLRFWARVNTGTQAVVPIIRNGSGSTADIELTSVTVTTTWTQYTVNLGAGRNAINQISFRMSLSSNTSRDLFLDEIELIPAP